MTDKEQEGIEKERDMSNAENEEEEDRTNGIDPGEGLEASRSVQQVSNDEEVKTAADPSETNQEEGMPEARPQQQILEREVDPTVTVSGNGTVEPDHRKVVGFFQVFIGIAQIFASLATVVAAVLALYTLKEMKIERNNAYHPEIVVTPATFEGGEISEGRDSLIQNVIYLDYQTDYLSACYLDVPVDSPGCLYLETPYLTLKNIGQGTAKDIQISFSRDWLEEAAEVIRPSEYDYSISIDSSLDNIEQYWINCSGPDVDQNYNLTTNKDMIKRISYIPTGDTTINVALPECWVRMLAILYSRAIWEEINEDYPIMLGDIPRKLDIPDPKINITYSDMQGIQTEDVLEIPWTGQYAYLIPGQSEDPEFWKKSIRLKNGFYEDYLG